MNKMIAVLVVVLGLTGTALAAERPTDNIVSGNVKSALRHDERVDASQVTVSVNRGIVKLVGAVDNLAAKNFADQEAKKINGVLGVVNELYVEPSWRLDSDIAHAIKRRILNSADIESQSISVSVAKGKATLHGTVASWSEREQAAVLAAETAGVTEIDNRLSSTWKSTRSDQAIKNDIVAAIGRDVYLSDQDIGVSVNDGAVVLAGSIGNAHEKDRAAIDARAVANVKRVTNNLKVVWWKDRGTRNETAHRSDSELKSAVVDELNQDSRINADDITVKTAYGHVTLDGTVYSHYQRRIAEQDVKDVIGVGWVTNNLLRPAGILTKLASIATNLLYP